MSNRGRKRDYKPPIPWHRLAAMRMAVFNLTDLGKPLSAEMAKEIGEALATISREFQAQIHPRGAPRNEDNWRVARLARWLAHLLEIEPEPAINAALDACRTQRVQDDDIPIAAIYDQLAAGLENDLGDRYFPTADLVQKALEILRPGKWVNIDN